MTTQTVTWRSFLDDHCRLLDTAGKQAFADALGVSKTTVNRWRRGENTPEAMHLQQLLFVFSKISESKKQQFLGLLRSDPKMWLLLPSNVQNAYPLALQQNEREGQISQFQFGMLDHFCLKMLRLQRDTPDRFWQVSSAVLREALTHLETYPEQTGLEIMIVKCMPPKDGKVRSLRMLVAMGTSPWRSDLHYKEGFLGIESLPGYAVARKHGEMLSNVTTSRHSHLSLAAFPIMRENGIAGALLVSSLQTDYFTSERMELLEIFADIIRLAFYDSDDFYPDPSIELGLMPPCPIQDTYFESFRRRVELEYRKATREEHASPKELSGMEDRVRAQLEDELLKIGGIEPEKATIIGSRFPSPQS